MSLTEKKKRKLLGKCATLAKDLQCIAEPYTHVRVTHIPKKQQQKFHWGLGRWECPMCLLTPLWLPCHNTENNEKASSKQIRGTTRDRESGSGRSGAQGETVRGRQIQREREMCLPKLVLLWTAAVKSTVNKLTLHNAKGADGKAMFGHTNPPVSLNPQEGRGALECHLQGKQ